MRERACYSILFDLKKVWDTTWKHGILRDLHGLGFWGRLPCFISNFLSDRLFQVKVGATLSDFHAQKNGVPQGSILSPVLFNTKINDIVEAVLKDSKSSLFVDDFALCLRGRSLPSVVRRLQLCVSSVNKWVQENGFTFSVSKTECVHFTTSKRCFYGTRHQTAWDFHQSGRWSQVFRASVRPSTYFQGSCQILEDHLP